MPEKIIHEASATEPTITLDTKAEQVAKDNAKEERFAEKSKRTLEYFNDMDNPEYDDVEKDILATGVSIPEFKKQWIESIDAMSGDENESISGSMAPDESYSNVYDFKNSVWDDFATHFQQGMNRVGFGLGVVIPGIAAAVPGEESEFVTDWIEGMTEWYEEAEERTSNQSNQSFFETGNIRAFAGGMGSGLASMAPMVLSFVPYVGKAAYMATTFSDVFGSVLSSGRENGLSIEEASQMALVLSVPITALEKVGMQGVTNPMKKGAVKYLEKGAINTAIKKVAQKGGTRLGLEEFKDIVSVGVKDIGKKAYAKRKVGNIAKAFGHGAGSEGFTETLQSILEQSGEQIWDNYFADEDAKVGEGKYGTDYRNPQFWLQAAEEGFYGAILGGVMSGGGSAKNGLKEQSAYHYVRTSLEKGKPQNIKALKNYAAKQEANGSMSKDELNNFVDKVDQMVKYEKQMWHKMDSPNAKYQSYNQMVTRDRASEVLESPWLEEQNTNYPEKKSQISELLTEIRNDSEKVVQAISNADEQVIEARKEHNSKVSTKLEKALFTPKEKYHYNPVNQNEIAPNLAANIKKVNEMLPKELRIDPLNNEQANNEGKIQTIKDGKSIVPEKPFGNVYKAKNEDGGEVVLTEMALSPDGKTEIIEAFEEAINASPEQKAAIIERIGNKFGIDKNAISHIYNNPEITEDGLTEIKSEEDEVEETETTPKEDVDEEFDSEKAYQELDKKLKEEFPEYDLTNIKEANVGGSIQYVDKNNKPIPGEVLDRIEEIKEEVFGSTITEEKVAEEVEETTVEEKGALEELQKIANETGNEISSILESKNLKNTITSFTNTNLESYNAKRNLLVDDIKLLVDEHGTDNASVEDFMKTQGSTLIKEVWRKHPAEFNKILSLWTKGKAAKESLKKETTKAESQKEQEQVDVTNVVSNEEQAEIDEDVARNTDAENRKMNALKKFLQPKEQRKGISSLEESLIKNNPELYNEIKKIFKKLFPFISVKEVNNLGEKYGAQVLARIVESGIEIDPTKAIQTSLIHEYGHVFLEILGDNHPLVKLGYKLVKDTQFFKDAQELYPDKTEAEQLNEALNEMIATNSLELLKNKVSGSKLAQVQEWLKSVWSKLKRLIGKANAQDVSRLLARQMTLSKQPFVVDQGSLVGLDKDQRNKIVNPRLAKAVDIISTTLTQQLLNVVSDKNTAFNNKDKSDTSFAAYYTLLTQYVNEKNNPTSTEQKVFDNVDLGIEMKEDYSYNDVHEFGEKLKEIDPKLYEVSNRVVNSMFNSNLELDKVEDINDEADQGDEGENKLSDNSIKATKKVSLSVRSILSTIVDADGYKVGSDAVFSYVGNVAERTYKKAGLLEALDKDKTSDPIAKRIVDIIAVLTPEQRAGFLQEISSLIQVKSEGANFGWVVTEDGTKKYSTTNPIRNKDYTYNGLEDRLNGLTTEQKAWLSHSNLMNSSYIKDVTTFIKDGIQNDNVDSFLKELSSILNLNISSEDLKSIITEFPEGKNTKVQNFFFALGGQYDSLLNVANGTNKFKDISGFLDYIWKGLRSTLLNNTYLNGANNTVTTTQLGNWVSTLNSMLMNDKSGRIKSMTDSDIYKNNPVFNYFKKNGRVDYSTFDSLKNFKTDENIEYKDMTDRDHMMLQLFKFATSSSKNYYSQSLGVKSNRQSATFFETPSYTNKEGKFDKVALTKAYNDQVNMLESILKPMLAKATAEGKKDLIEDFNSLYIHTANANGTITSGFNPSKYASDINEIKILAKANGLDEAFSKKVGGKNQFSSFDNMVENFYFIEAINRTSLNDIYGGVALEYANLVAGERNKDGSRKGGGVQQMVKRLSSSDSNGKQIEMDKPIHYIVYDSGVSGSDSFKFNGSHLTEHIDKETGSLDPLGINSKELVFQVDPKTAQTVYIKSSGLNLKVNPDGTNNLQGFGDNMSKIADAMLAVEKMLTTTEDPNPYVVFMDSKASKGTHNFKTVNFSEVMAGNLNSVSGNVNTIAVDNLTTPFNLNKALAKVEQQEAILSTQAAIIQFNATHDYGAFEEVAVRYLEKKMQNNFTKKNVVQELENYDNVIDELTKDMNEREKSSITEILDAIKEHNATSDNKITSFDHSSLRLIYEQFVSSRLSKKGVKIDMEGNFMHQLPDMGGVATKLADKEIAVSWKMFGNTKEEAERLLNAGPLEVVVVRIPASAEMSIEASTVKYFLDTDANVAVLSDEFVRRSDSDHDGDKVMVYRQEIKNGEFVSEEDSIKTEMFNRLHDNATSPEFLAKQDNTLELKPLYDAVGDTKRDFKVATLKDLINVAEKMGLGQTATGRFAIASKLISLLSQSNEKLIKTIMFNGKPLQDFTNQSLDDVAILLQAALDIGNDPILANTGFTDSTINIGNAMLSLGLKTKEVIDFLNTNGVTNLVEDFKSKNLGLSERNKLSFDNYFKSLLKNKEGKLKTQEQLEETSINGVKIGNDWEIIKKFEEFKNIADGLSKMIAYIQLDKGLPNNAEGNRTLLDNISSFKALPFTTGNLTVRDLSRHRVDVARSQKMIYEKHLLTSNPSVVAMIEEVSNLTDNPFAFRKKVTETILKIFAQKQINTKRDNVKEWFYDFGNRLSAIKSGNTDNITVSENSQENDATIAMNTLMNENPFWTKEEAILDYGGGDISLIPKYLDLLGKYETAINEVENASKFKDNTFFNYLQFPVQEDGKVLMRLDPKFKATTQVTQDIKDGFKDIQGLDPQLANDIIDYQLYRHGTNNKIGSLIDVLPRSIDINQLIDTTEFKNQIESMPEVDSKYLISDTLVDNIIADNKDLLSNVSYKNDIAREDAANGNWFILNADSKLSKQIYLEYNDSAYKYSKDSNSYVKIQVESDKNFTAFKEATPRSQAITEAASSIAELGIIQDISTFTNYSGAAQGGDTIWENIGKEFGLGRQINYRPEDLQKLSSTQKQEIENAYQQAVKDLGRKPLAANTFAGGLVRRDYLQAKSADTVFAISTIIEPGQKDSKGYINKTNKPLVAGGTGYAVQMAINLRKSVYVFDQVQNQWFNWDNSTNTFIATETPILTSKFAGIGTREINELGKQAIRDVYQKTTEAAQPIRGKDIEEIATEEIPNEVILSDNTILTLPNESTNIDLGPRGNFTMNTDGSIVNNATGNIVIRDSPIYFNVIAKYQEDQANDEQNKCN